MIGSRKLLDHWQAPEGAGKPVACLAASFTFEPDFFEEDCLARFLGLDSVRGESDPLAYVIEEEERLAEVRAAVLVDRSQDPGNRNLRWDLLSVGVPGGFLHAKVSLLVWDRAVRVIVGSANLTRAGYRSQVEAAVAFDAFSGSEIPRAVFHDLLAILRALLERAPGDTDSPGPKQRAAETLDRAAGILDGFDLPATPPRGAPEIRAALVEPGRSAFEALRAVWRGGPPRRAAVVSPFFDTGTGENLPARALAGELARRGPCEATFVLPTDHLAARTVVRAPKALTGALPTRIRACFHALPHEEKEDPRRLHAKAIRLASDQWVAALVGSSNFTSAGLGLAKDGHLEANVAIGARLGSETGRALLSFVPETETIEVDEVEWEAQEDEDEAPGVQLPLGFVDCLVEPGTHPAVILRLDPAHLPDDWRVEVPKSGELIIDRAGWVSQGQPATAKVPLLSSDLPFWVQVRWTGPDGELSTGLPVNVTEPSKLPPPKELRDLPVRLLLRVLGSSRPVHEALAAEIRRADSEQAAPLPPELDPLRRYSRAGQLLHRAREASAALAGLQDRLERPVATLDALEWRLEGPLGPAAIAEGLLRARDQEGMVEGEPAFLLAELALTLSRVDWEKSGRVVGVEAVRARIHRLMSELRARRVGIAADPRLQRYVDEAFRRVRI